MDGPGLIHVYCGDGKGKTSAALGLALRARGAGLRVLFAWFMKGRESGETAGLRRLGIDTIRHTSSAKFLADMDGEERRAFAREQRLTLDEALARAPCHDLLVLDEAAGAARAGLIPGEAVTQFLETKPPGLEVAITGRNPPGEWVERADYVSEIHAVRHPYERGIGARRGIEY